MTSRCGTVLSRPFSLQADRDRPVLSGGGADATIALPTNPPSCTLSAGRSLLTPLLQLATGGFGRYRIPPPARPRFGAAPIGKLSGVFTLATPSARPTDEPALRRPLHRDWSFTDVEFEPGTRSGKMASLGDQREPSLYNGVSNRSRGWKSRTFDDFLDVRAAHLVHLRRWDGAARMCYDWNHLRRVSVPNG